MNNSTSKISPYCGKAADTAQPILREALILLFLLFTLLPMGAVKKFDVNPINLAVVLVEKADSTNIDSFFKYYGYTLQDMEDGYNVMKHPNGNEIRYSFKNNGLSQKYPTIIVKTMDLQKDIDSRLSELKFQKTGNVYEREVSKYNNFITRCQLGNSNQITFERIQKKQKRER